MRDGDVPTGIVCVVCVVHLECVDYGDLLVFRQDVWHIHSPYANYRTPIISACQGVFSWYSIYPMKLAALMVLAVVQAATPTPRQTTNNPSSTGNGVERDAATKHDTPGNPTPIHNQVSTPPSLHSTQNKPSDEEARPVEIRSVPVISISKDWPITIFTGLLVLITGFETYLLCRTLGAVNRQLVLSVKQTRAILAQTRATARSAQASEQSNSQSATFFKMEKRPWVGMNKGPTVLEKKSTKPGQYGFTVGYTVKNFGIAPAFNTIVVFEAAVEDVNNYALVKSKVDAARKTGESIINVTGDLLLPTGEKNDTCLFSEISRADKFVVPGCIVYRFADGTVHHTELSYWIDFGEGEKAFFRTSWFQAAD